QRGGVDGALFQCRGDVAPRDLLRYAADLGDDGAGESADPEFQATEIIHRLDLFPEPAAHLGAGATGGDADALVVLQEVVEQFSATAETQPGDMRPRVETERQRGAEGESGILAPVVIERRVAHLDGAVRDGIEHLQAGDDFARSK